MTGGPDLSAIIGRVHVDLWRGFFRDEVRVWLDVRPAAGGLLSRRKVRHSEADAAFDAEVAKWQEERDTN